MKSVNTCKWCGKKIKHPHGVHNQFCSKKCEDAFRGNALEICDPKLAYFVERVKNLR